MASVTKWVGKNPIIALIIIGLVLQLSGVYDFGQLIPRQAIAGVGQQQEPGITVAGTYTIPTMGAGISDVDGKSGMISVQSGTPDTGLTDLSIRLEQSIKSTTGAVTYTGASCTVYDANNKQPIGGTITVLDTGTSTTNDPAVGQSVYVICTNSSLYTAKFGPFTVGGPITQLRGVMDVAATPALYQKNVTTNQWVANVNWTVGASTTTKDVSYYVYTTTARGVLSNPHMAISADLTSNFTTFEPTGGTEVSCPTRLTAQSNQELKCFDLGLGKQVTVNQNGPANTYTIVSGALDPIQGATDPNSVAVAVTIYDTACYVLNNDLVCGVGEDNTNADVGAGDATGYIGIA